MSDDDLESILSASLLNQEQTEIMQEQVKILIVKANEKDEKMSEIIEKISDVVDELPSIIKKQVSSELQNHVYSNTHQLENIAKNAVNNGIKSSVGLIVDKVNSEQKNQIQNINDLSMYLEQNTLSLVQTTSDATRDAVSLFNEATEKLNKDFTKNTNIFNKTLSSNLDKFNNTLAKKTFFVWIGVFFLLLVSFVVFMWSFVPSQLEIKDLRSRVAILNEKANQATAKLNSAEYEYQSYKHQLALIADAKNNNYIRVDLDTCDKQLTMAESIRQRYNNANADRHVYCKIIPPNR